ncbi:Cysteine-rich domain-containing protein [Desulfonema limicola]|uniref:Cysteine-rich domain-containing protein n=1 Tax=Desulfonema limicola TaxID=45656 RepID=A0A975B8V7_9BACT|nr:CoB--CoM heterodisulfide reductase iron-sulfur subunit B family protein [Desulfonema limicola]QTA80935.1 Cysteine-rich domain-containing protein [Desulfonema limicola]
MKYAYFPGCKIPYHLPEYDIAVRAVLDRLEVRLVDLNFNCCGYPVRHQSFEASVLSGARNLAVARKEHLTIVTPCKCCFGSLKHVEYWMKQRPVLREKINRILAEEGLKWDNDIRVIHLLTLLAEDVGEDAIKQRIINPLKDLKIAAHYGCHALRPGEVVQFDNPLAPTIFEKLIHLTGAETIDWPLRLECCGSPLWEKNNRLSIKLMNKKLRNAYESGADIIATACTYCQIQFEQVRSGLPEDKQKFFELKAVLYPQILGNSMGIKDKQINKWRDK